VLDMVGMDGAEIFVPSQDADAMTMAALSRMMGVAGDEPRRSGLAAALGWR
jgi:hypothetical protein